METAATADDDALRAGVATEDITPPPGVRLSGFAGRDWRNAGSRDPLRASALYLEQGNRAAAVLVTLDVIGLGPRDDARLRRAIAAQFGIGADAVLVACSHTHSGPATMNIRATGGREAAWTGEVLRRATRAALRARESAVAVGRVETGAAPCGASVNRRVRLPSGEIVMGEGEGFRDPECRVLLLRPAGGDAAPLAAVFHYAMHPVSLDRDNRLTSGDWVAVARERVEAEAGCPALFVQGCCGDINPRVRGSGACADLLGAQVADAALAALGGDGGLRALAEVRLGTGAAVARLPLQPLPDPGALARVEADAAETLARRDAPLATRQIAQADREWVRACRRRAASPGAPRAALPARLQALTLGEITLVSLPGEPFARTGQMVRDQVPGAWPVGYAGSNLGYLCPDDVLEAGGYEADVAYRLDGEQNFGPGTEAALVRAAARAARLAARAAATGSRADRSAPTRELR
jgi:hypothetical protein